MKDIKLNDIKSLAHTTWNCKYHVVFAPKKEKEEEFDFNILNLNFETKGYECKRCPNNCEIIAIKKDKKIIDAWGNRCEKGSLI